MPTRASQPSIPSSTCCCTMNVPSKTLVFSFALYLATPFSSPHTLTPVLDRHPILLQKNKHVELGVRTPSPPRGPHKEEERQVRTAGTAQRRQNGRYSYIKAHPHYTTGIRSKTITPCLQKAHQTTFHPFPNKQKRLPNSPIPSILHARIPATNPY